MARRSLSRTIAKLGLWYFALLLPTLYFKYAYLSSQAEEGVFATLDAAGLGGGGQIARLSMIFAGDLIEVLLLVLLLFAIGVVLLSIDIDVIIAASVCLGLLVSAGNWLSFEVVGTLLNYDNLALAYAWTREHPEVIGNDRSGVLLLLAAAGLVALALLWSTAVFLAARCTITDHSARTVARCAVVSVAALQLVGASAGITSEVRAEPAPAAFRGYWTATAVSIVGADGWRPLEGTRPTGAGIDSAYRRLAYPDAAAELVAPLLVIPESRRVPRHIVIVSLETAPRKYYQLADNPDLPTFERMGRRGIVSDHHYTTDPATTWAIFSLLSGTYPRQGKSLLDYGDFSTDGIASVLGRRGYDTFFIDSYRIDWQTGYHRDHSSRMLRDLGFAHLVDAGHDSTPKRGTSSYARAVAQERRSFARALESIGDAQRHGTHALVFIATILGHYPWNAPPSLTGRPSKEKLAATAKVLDGLVGEFLRALDERGFGDSTIIVVTGDHGLRAKSEFASLDEAMRFGEVAFNVPFVLYAPGLFDAGTRLPYVTSHIDVAPTLLELVGVRTDSLLLHGASMLGQTQRRRVTFLMSNSLRPVDGFYQEGYFFVFNRFTGEVRVTRAPSASRSEPPSGLVPDGRPSPGLARRIASEIEEARSVFDTTAAYFLQRAAPRRSAP